MSPVWLAPKCLATACLGTLSTLRPVWNQQVKVFIRYTELMSQSGNMNIKSISVFFSSSSEHLHDFCVLFLTLSSIYSNVCQQCCCNWLQWQFRNSLWPLLLSCQRDCVCVCSPVQQRGVTTWKYYSVLILHTRLLG